METSVSDRLQNLKAVLHKIMGPESITCLKYTDALEDAIEYMGAHKMSVSTPIFRLSVETTKFGGIIVHLYSTDDEHLQTIAFAPDDIVDDTIHGDA